jgi:hypothetical protein
MGNAPLEILVKNPGGFYVANGGVREDNCYFAQK